MRLRDRSSLSRRPRLFHEQETDLTPATLRVVDHIFTIGRHGVREIVVSVNLRVCYLIMADKLQSVSTNRSA